MYSPTHPRSTRYLDLMAEAYVTAGNSPDPSTQNGAVLLTRSEALIHGWNHIPEALEPDYDDRAHKYERICHAEEHTIYRAARWGLPSSGAVMVCPWAPCIPCARAILFAGIRLLVVHKQRMDLVAPDGAPLVEGRKAWAPDVEEALSCLRRGGVGIEWIDGPVDADPIRVAGKYFHPKEA